MLLSDSKYLFCYCTTKLSWITRRAPFDKATLKDDSVTVDFQEVTTENDIVTVVATEPLTTNEAWYKLDKGELVVFKQGEVVFNQV